MHYKNGREVNIGDKVVGRDYVNNPVCGVVINMMPAETCCNISVVSTTNFLNYTANDFLHIDDAIPQVLAPAAQ